MGFNNLILLIGTNPLPNFVVADYYLHNPRLTHIWLVHSEKTKVQDGTLVYAENLKKAIEKRIDESCLKHKQISISFVSLSNVSDAKQISLDINNLLINKLCEGSSVHLNYTGGTKVMGTHSYLALKNTSKSLEKSYSYLDARTFKIIDDDNGYITTDLRDSVKISFEDLIQLHAFERQNRNFVSYFPNVLGKFKKRINSNCMSEFFNTNGGYKRKLFENINKKGELAEKVYQTDVQEIKKYSPNQVFQKVLDSFPDKCNPINDISEITDSNFKKAVKFLDGLWFEEFIYLVLIENLKEPNIEILLDWEIKKSNWKTNFQLDVILVKGYQLIGISCTTSRSKPLCKSKGFEIIQRTKQIGGDEARAILFTLLDDANKTELQNELIEDTGGAMSNILVFGFDDINESYIIDKINNFVK